MHITRGRDPAGRADSTRCMLIKASTSLIISRFLRRTALRFPFALTLHCRRWPIVILARSTIGDLVGWRRCGGTSCHGRCARERLTVVVRLLLLQLQLMMIARTW